MDALSISQTIFYALASIVLIIIGGFLVIASFRLLGILKDAKDVADDIKLTYMRARRKINKFIGSVRNKRK